MLISDISYYWRCALKRIIAAYIIQQLLDWNWNYYYSTTAAGVLPPVSSSGREEKRWWKKKKPPLAALTISPLWPQHRNTILLTHWAMVDIPCLFLKEVPPKIRTHLSLTSSSSSSSYYLFTYPSISTSSISTSSSATSSAKPGA